MGLSAHVDHFLSYLGMVIGIVALGLTLYLSLTLGGPFVRRIGPGAMGAINRNFGFLDSGDCGTAGLGWSGRFSRLRDA